MTERIPKLFRSLNSRLIKTENILLEKVLKVFFTISLITYRRERKKIVKDAISVIDNFDGTISMELNRSRSIGAALYWTGFHEFREFIFLDRFLKADMVLVDVGANQGEYSLFAAKRLSRGRVLAFEPVSSIRNVFYKNVELNAFDNIEIFEFGLSDKSGILKIHEFEYDNEGLATLYPGNRTSSTSFDVRLEPLDHIFDTTKFTRLDFIKIDIEGGELKALQGAKNVIEKFKPIVMIEVNETSYQAAGYTTAEIINFFDDLHYKAFEIGKRGKLKACTKLPAFGNIIFKRA